MMFNLKLKSFVLVFFSYTYMDLSTFYDIKTDEVTEDNAEKVTRATLIGMSLVVRVWYIYIAKY